MEAQDFFEQTQHQLKEMQNVFTAYNLGEELSFDQLQTLKMHAYLLYNDLVVADQKRDA